MEVSQAVRGSVHHGTGNGHHEMTAILRIASHGQNHPCTELTPHPAPWVISNSPQAVQTPQDSRPIMALQDMTNYEGESHKDAQNPGTCFTGRASLASLFCLQCPSLQKGSDTTGKSSHLPRGGVKLVQCCQHENRGFSHPRLGLAHDVHPQDRLRVTHKAQTISLIQETITAHGWGNSMAGREGQLVRELSRRAGRKSVGANK